MEAQNYINVANRIANYLNGIGLFTSKNICTSNGFSCYITVAKSIDDGNTHTIRVSDHSVSSYRRLIEELHVGYDLKEYQIQEAINTVEYYYYPDRFNKIENKKYNTVKIECNENELKATDIILSERITNEGRKMLTVNRTYENITYSIERK